jgi:two-component system, chemotaxis family, sensor kinase CheA
MRMNEEELLEKLREAFSVEAQERIASLSASLLSLEKGTSGEAKARDLEVAFREAHSLKGAARSVNLGEIETICQAVEGVFAAMKRDEIRVSGGLFDLLHRCVNVIEALLAASETERPDRSDEIASLVAELQGVQAGKAARILKDKPGQKPIPKDVRAHALHEEKAPESEEARGASDRPTSVEQAPSSEPVSGAPAPRRSFKESIRVSSAKLDSLFLKVQEMISLKLTSGQHLADLEEMLRALEDWRKRWSAVEGQWRLVQKMGDGEAVRGLAQFIDWNAEFLQSLDLGLRAVTKRSEQNGRVLARMVDDLLDDMKGIIMLPFSMLLDGFPRMVREISREQGKEVDLIIRGGTVDVDRRILDEMRDPLIHILRNAVDHGLESPETRKERGKPRTGTIELAVSQAEGGKVEIVISDDGAGIDPIRLKKKAHQLGILTEQEVEALNDREALSLIFHSGVSTSPIVTDISGRGLGLAIVEEKIDQLGGLLTLDSAPGNGTSFKMILPVTMSAFRGVLVRTVNSSFIVPSAQMERAVRVPKEQVKTVENRPTIPLDGKTLALVDLADVFGLPQPNGPTNGNSFVTAAVLGKGERRVAFSVDEVAGEQEVLVKGLGKQLRHVPWFSGATILGSGQVVPILNVNELLTSALKTPVRDRGTKGSEEQTKMPSILVAEDSITSRTLIKNILEGAGYHVQTAVDGAEAFAALKTGQFDLVVSDVEMPRMDGFELTRRIRGEEKYADLPVVLVTGLETREDREKGIDAGASAYIVKSSFDQSNLIEVIRRMV